jgi:carotenoid cleavage dioxygenase-like enzyme
MTMENSSSKVLVKANKNPAFVVPSPWILLLLLGVLLIPTDAFVPDWKRSVGNQNALNNVFQSDVLEAPSGLLLPDTTMDFAINKEAQLQAEEEARNRHDNYAMNALFVNVQEHCDPTACTIMSKGPLPKDLPAGCLLRIGPNGATKEEGWLDGDGLIQCVVIPPNHDDDDDDDEISSSPVFSSTYVDTRGRSLERNSKEDTNTDSEGKRFRGTLGAAPNGLPMLKGLVQNGIDFNTLTVQKDTCNTAMARSGDRVMALMEQSPPSEIQVSKEGRVKTIGSMCRLDGAVKEAPITGGSCGAHGRTDPHTKERIHVSYSSSKRPFVRVDTFADNWKLLSSVGVDVPVPVMIHDLAITEQYVVLMDFPLTVRPRRFLADLFPVEYEPSNGARIGLSTRAEQDDEPQTTQWFDVEEGVVLHLANAFERPDGKVVVHGFKSLPKGESSYILDYTTAFLHEWILDPMTGQVIHDRCLNPDELVEFPIVEDRFIGSNDAGCIYGLQVTSIGGPIYESKTPQVGVLLDGLVKLSTEEDDTAGQVLDRYTLEQGWHFVSEPTVVTKTSGDGHYIVLCATFVPPEDASSRSGTTHDELARDGSSLRSRLLVLDGESISSGPVSIIELPYHMNYGLHSMFLPWDKMK